MPCGVQPADRSLANTNSPGRCRESPFGLADGRGDRGRAWRAAEGSIGLPAAKQREQTLPGQEAVEEGPQEMTLPTARSSSKSPCRWRRSTRRRRGRSRSGTGTRARCICGGRGGRWRRAGRCCLRRWWMTPTAIRRIARPMARSMRSGRPSSGPSCSTSSRNWSSGRTRTIPRVINAARAEIARCVASRKIELGELKKDIRSSPVKRRARRIPRGPVSGDGTTAWEIVLMQARRRSSTPSWPSTPRRCSTRSAAAARSRWKPSGWACGPMPATSTRCRCSSPRP